MKCIILLLLLLSTNFLASMHSLIRASKVIARKTKPLLKQAIVGNIAKLKALNKFNQFNDENSKISLKTSIKLLNKTIDNNFIYDSEIRKKTDLLEKKFYSNVVQNLPIVCVDTFVLNIDTGEYLLIRRKTNPAKDVFWLPGGRLYKGESFFECALRKCYEESGLMVTAKALIDVYSTTFINSEWNTPTHTINIAVLAFVNGENVPKLNEFHTDYQWVPVNSYSDNEYVETIRRKAIEIIDSI